MMDRIKLASIVITLIIVTLLSLLAKNSSIRTIGKTIGNYKEQVFSEPIQNEDSLETSLKFVSGEVNLFPITVDHLFQFTAKFKLPEAKPIVQYKTENSEGKLTITTRMFQKLGIASKSLWNLGLHTNIHHKVSIESKASQQNLNFTGIPISFLHLITGASKTNMYFNKANPIEMEEIKIESGASNCRIFGITNARAKNVMIHGGTGTYHLDFAGEQTSSCNVVVDGGISLARLVIPKKINARIHFRDKLITYLDISGFYKISENLYISQGFSKENPILDINIFVGSGRIIIQNSFRRKS